jgi:ketosteroid isomerase-like protein
VAQAQPQRALEALLNERAGAKAVDEFQASFEQSAGRKAERVNPVLAVVGRGSADRAFYDALFRRLVETTPMPDSEMTSLAQRRGEATARALRERATAATNRVEVGDARAAERADKNAVPTRLELGVAS